MYCRKCGKEIKEGEIFCSKCGTKLENLPAQNPNNNVSTQPSPSKEPTQESSPGKKLLIFISIIAVILIIGVIYDSAHSTESENLTIDQIAEQQTAGIAEYQKSYTIRPSGGIAFMGVSKHDTYNVVSETLNNVIAIEVYADENYVQNFMSDYAYAYTLNKNGEEKTDYSTGVYLDSDTDKLYILLYSSEKITNEKYVVLGGFEKEKNYGSNKLIFEIK